MLEFKSTGSTKKIRAVKKVEPLQDIAVGMLKDKFLKLNRQRNKNDVERKHEKDNMKKNQRGIDEWRGRSTTGGREESKQAEKEFNVAMQCTLRNSRKAEKRH